LKTISRSTAPCFKNFNRPCDPAHIFLIAITIAFENRYRINRTVL